MYLSHQVTTPSLGGLGQRHCRTPAMPRLDRIGKKSPDTGTENAKWHLICIVQVPVEGVHVWALYPIQ